jgi:CRP-like cAMP-binding protein
MKFDLAAAQAHLARQREFRALCAMGERARASNAARVEAARLAAALTPTEREAARIAVELALVTRQRTTPQGIAASVRGSTPADVERLRASLDRAKLECWRRDPRTARALQARRAAVVVK